MLEFFATNDKKQLDAIMQDVFGKDFPGQVGYVLSYNDTIIGISKISVTPEISSIKFIGISKPYRKKGFGDFFTRSLMNTLSYVSEVIVIEYVSNYYLQFGFVEKNKTMTIDSKNIIFPSKCGH
ncbi:MAG TPA: GNAT family N-acetyltransferase [Clostridiales bacterium]|nr:GNAT family N-acetyltransferase [Clostridiales bacterium]